ncbi:MAG TPA: ABC transporter substrate-binding protein [Tepidisphaeraceae bacterium]|nr:ABC transporter substrate-binding protein [Tepidisphaeraceae bacterium]
MRRWTVPAACVVAISLAVCGSAAQEQKAQRKQPTAAKAGKSGAAAKPKANQTAAEAGKAYAERMREDSPAAIREYWDIDALLAAVFGDELKKHSADERADMKRMMLSFFEKRYGNPALAKFMATAKFGEFTQEDGEAGEKLVQFDTQYADGRGSSQTLKMKTSGGAWKVTDQATNGTWGSDALRSQYESRKDQATPMQALRQMVGEPEPQKKEPKKPEAEDVPF